MLSSSNWSVFDDIATVDDFIDNAVFFGRCGVHDEISVGVGVNSFQILPSVASEDAFKQVSLAASSMSVACPIAWPYG